MLYFEQDLPDGNFAEARRRELKPRTISER
jgi:hypothetical protein